MPLKVVIVGAGLSGLVASHCLCHAGIDHVVLEKRPHPAPATGASIAIFPNGARILHQLGVLDALKEHAVPLEKAITRLPSGRALSESKLPTHVQERHGEDIILLDRQKLLRIIFDQLPKQTVQFSKAVTSIVEDEDRVLVSLADGSTESCHVVIGCDGVYSKTRSSMWNHALEDGRPLGDERAIYTDWLCLAGVSEPHAGLGSANLTTVLGPGRSLLFNTQPDASYFFILKRLPRRKYFDERGSRYSIEDANDFAHSVGECPVTQTTAFREIWEKRRRAQLVPVEEGILRNWHYGRIVLVGDCVHKMTPNSGFGGNACIESAAVICNKLKELQDSGNVITAARLTEGFRQYQEERFARCEMLVNASGGVTKLHAWETVWYRIKSTWVMPFGNDEERVNPLSQMIKSAPKVSDLSTEGFGRGSIPWDDEDECRGAQLTTGKVEARFVSTPLKTIGFVAIIALSLVTLRRFIR